MTVKCELAGQTERDREEKIMDKPINVGSSKGPKPYGLVSTSHYSVTTHNHSPVMIIILTTPLTVQFAFWILASLQKSILNNLYPNLPRMDVWR